MRYDFDEVKKHNDLNNHDEAIGVIKHLLSELKMYAEHCKISEEYLQKVMTKKQYAKYVETVALKLFVQDVKNLPDGDFKDFVINDVINDDTGRNIVGLSDAVIDEFNAVQEDSDVVLYGDDSDE